MFLSCRRGLGRANESLAPLQPIPAFFPCADDPTNVRFFRAWPGLLEILPRTSLHKLMGMLRVEPKLPQGREGYTNIFKCCRGSSTRRVLLAFDKRASSFHPKSISKVRRD